MTTFIQVVASLLAEMMCRNSSTFYLVAVQGVEDLEWHFLIQGLDYFFFQVQKKSTCEIAGAFCIFCEKQIQCLVGFWC